MRGFPPVFLALSTTYTDRVALASSGFLHFVSTVFLGSTLILVLGKMCVCVCGGGGDADGYWGGSLSPCTRKVLHAYSLDMPSTKALTVVFSFPGKEAA